MISNWVIRPVPKYIHNEDRNSPLSPLLYCLRLMAHNLTRYWHVLNTPLLCLNSSPDCLVLIWVEWSLESWGLVQILRSNISNTTWSQWTCPIKWSMVFWSLEYAWWFKHDTKDLVYQSDIWLTLISRNGN